MWTKASLAVLLLSGFIAGLDAQVLSFAINCTFGNEQILEFQGYTCTLRDLDFDFSSAFYFIRVGGVHMDGQTNRDVTNLRILDSRINRVPANIFHVFPNIESFEVTNCGSINFVVPDFSYADNLRNVHIRDNLIPFIPPSVFFIASNIEVLNLENNSINSLGPSPFGGIAGRLRSVTISNNNISVLTPRMTSGLTQIEEFISVNNNIEEIDGRLFVNSPALRVVNFSGNNIKAIGLSFLNVNANLERLFLSNNECVDTNFDTIDLGIVRDELEECFRQSPWGTQIVLTVTGSLTVFDENDNVMIRID